VGWEGGLYGAGGEWILAGVAKLYAGGAGGKVVAGEGWWCGGGSAWDGLRGGSPIVEVWACCGGEAGDCLGYRGWWLSHECSFGFVLPVCLAVGGIFGGLGLGCWGGGACHAHGGLGVGGL